jgi:rhodanese-related sulfurtransferase
MSRISAFKNKINRLEEKNNNLEISSIKNESLILKYRKDLKVLRDKVIDHEESSTFQYSVEKEKEIIVLKQEGQCKQIDINSLVDKLYKSTKDLRDANESIVGLNVDIKNAEDRKFKNRFKKFLVG